MTDRRQSIAIGQEIAFKEQVLTALQNLTDKVESLETQLSNNCVAKSKTKKTEK